MFLFKEGLFFTGWLQGQLPSKFDQMSIRKFWELNSKK